MSNSNLVTYTNLSPNCNSPRNMAIDKITIHHMAAPWTVERCGESFAQSSRQASSNYGIDSEGHVGLYVDEGDRAWTSGSPSNDNRAVTIEVANDVCGENWHVSDVAYNKLIDLCVDICQRNGIESINFTGGQSGNLTLHKYFQPTACPAEYLESKMPEIANAINERLGVHVEPTVYPAPVVETTIETSVDVVEPDVTVQVNIGGREQWLGEMSGCDSDITNQSTGYAGVVPRTVEGVCIRTKDADFGVRYSVRLKSGRILGVIDSRNADLSNEDTGFAGIIGQEIDGITMFLEGTDEYDIRYQVKLSDGKILGELSGSNSNWYDYDNGYAGIPGCTISGITARIVRR